MKNLFDFKKLKKKLQVIQAAYLDVIFICIVIGLAASHIWMSIIIAEPISILSLFAQTVAVLISPLVGALIVLLLKINVD